MRRCKKGKKIIRQFLSNYKGVIYDSFYETCKFFFHFTSSSQASLERYTFPTTSNVLLMKSRFAPPNYFYFKVHSWLLAHTLTKLNFFFK